MRIAFSRTHILLASLGSSGLAHPRFSLCSLPCVSQDQTSLEGWAWGWAQKLGSSDLCWNTSGGLLSRSSEESSWGTGRAFGIAFLPNLLCISFKFFLPEMVQSHSFGPLGHVGFLPVSCLSKSSGLTGRVTAWAAIRKFLRCMLSTSLKSRGCLVKIRENPGGHDPCPHVREEMRLCLMAPEGGAGLRPESRNSDRPAITTM